MDSRQFMDCRQFVVSNQWVGAEPSVPRFVDKARAFIAAYDEPLLEYPEHPDRELFVVSPFGFSLTLYVGRDAIEIPPAPTNRVFFTMHGLSFEAECANHGITPDQLDEPLSPRFWQDCWFSDFSPNVLAYFYLQRLDLGPPTGTRPQVEVDGEITFSDGNFPGCDARVVGIEDLLSISLLQNRLNELGENTVVHLDESAREYFKPQRERDEKSLQPELPSVSPDSSVNHRGFISQGEAR